MYEAIRFFSLVLLKLLYRMEVRGRENVPPTGGAVLASNHASFIDPVAIQCATTRKVTFLARRTLSKSLFYRFFTSEADIIAVERDSSDRGSLHQVSSALAQGRMVLLFPEGTRSDDGALSELKAGFSVMARRTGVPVIPVRLDGTYHAWPRQRRFPRLFGRIRVSFGAPLAFEGRRSHRDDVQRLREAIEGLSIPLGESTMIRGEAALRS